MATASPAPCSSTRAPASLSSYDVASSSPRADSITAWTCGGNSNPNPSAEISVSVRNPIPVTRSASVRTSARTSR